MTISYVDISVQKLQILKVIFGCIFLAIPVIAYPWLFILILILPMILMVREGVEFDIEQGTYRRYKQFVKKKGEWKPLNQFSKVILKPTRGQRHMYHVYSATHKRYDEFIHDVYLMSENHGKRLFIRTCKRKSSAKKLAEELSLLTGFDIEKYHPVPVKRK